MEAVLQLPMVLRQQESYRWLEITVGTAVLSECCLQLCLLNEGLIEAISVTSPDGAVRLRIRCDHHLSKSQRRTVVWTGSDADVSITPTELGAWLHFFLVYYRDGAADVPDLDFEAMPDDHDSGAARGIVFLAAASKPPRSGDELRRQLGL